MMTDNKCPECRGARVVWVENHDCDPPDVWMEDCPTCTGTGEKKLDRPPLISRVRAESAVGVTDCSGREFTPEEKEDLIRMVLFGALIQRDKDWFDWEKKLDSPELREKLVEWIASYKDVAGRNALAETPEESAEYLIKTLIEPLIEEAKKLGFDEGIKRATDACNSTFDAQLKEATKQNTERIDAMLMEARRTAKTQVITKLKQAVKDTRDGKDIDLPEELYEVFCSIQNQAIERSQEAGTLAG